MGVDPDANIAGLPGMFDRTFSCSSLSKANSITGWRLGNVIAASELIEDRVH
jgi:aminotransferase